MHDGRAEWIFSGHFNLSIQPCASAIYDCCVAQRRPTPHALKMDSDVPQQSPSVNVCHLSTGSSPRTSSTGPKLPRTPTTQSDRSWLPDHASTVEIVETLAYSNDHSFHPFLTDTTPHQ
jgi:hypothetical protein